MTPNPTCSFPQGPNFVSSGLFPDESPQVADEGIQRLRHGAVISGHINRHVVVIFAPVFRMVNGQIHVVLLPVIVQLLIGIVVALLVHAGIHAGVVVVDQFQICLAEMWIWIHVLGNARQTALAVFTDETILLKSPQPMFGLPDDGQHLLCHGKNAVFPLIWIEDHLFVCTFFGFFLYAFTSNMFAAFHVIFE